MAGTIKADIIQSELSTPTVFRNSSNTEIGTLCRSWLNYNGITPAVRASFNVSSVTRNATGDNTTNFTTSMTDGNYSISFVSDVGFSTTNHEARAINYGTPAAGSMRVYTGNSYITPSGENHEFFALNIFR